MRKQADKTLDSGKVSAGRSRRWIVQLNIHTAASKHEKDGMAMAHHGLGRLHPSLRLVEHIGELQDTLLVHENDRHEKDRHEKDRKARRRG